MRYFHFVIDDSHSITNNEEHFFKCLDKMGDEAVVLVYKDASKRAGCNRVHRGNKGCVRKRMKFDGVTNKIVARNLVDAAMLASKMGVRYELCGGCFRDIKRKGK